MVSKMYDELIKRLRNRRICIQQLGTLNDYPLLCEADDAIEELMRDLVLIGVTLTLLSTTRPGSGSEHHLSHYFEITGLVEGKP